MHKTKIVCTIGPASDSQERLEELAAAGMSVARLNASHGSRGERAEVIDRVRAAEETSEHPIAILHDIPGPEVRTAPLDDPIELESDSEVRFINDETATSEKIGLSVSIAAAEPGDRVLLDDGRIETTVTAVEDDTVVARVEAGGELGGRAGVNIPGVDVGLDLPTETDRRELELAAEKGVDFVAASFVRDAEDIYAVGAVLEECDASVPIIAKIERVNAIENIEGIIDAVYGVMVARGDLGVECPIEDVPMLQKWLIRRCHQAGVPVITATEMLDSMVHEHRPTRAEVTDVANAVLDGTDAVMLSGETAVGDHPVHVTETMRRITDDVEESDEYAALREQRVPPTGESRTDALARSARSLATDIDARAVVVATESGYTALTAAKYRPAVPIIATTPDEHVRRQLALSHGVIPMYVPLTTQGASAVIQNAIEAARDTAVVERGDIVVVLSGMMTGMAGADTTNTLKVHVATETVITGQPVVNGRAAGALYRVSDGDLTAVPDKTILAVPETFDAELTGDLSTLAGIIAEQTGSTSYPAIVARELDVPMISGATLSDDVADDTTVTLDAVRGVVYQGDVTEKIAVH
jgi:pyruvate kinase